MAEPFGDYPPARHLLRDLQLAVDRREGALRVTAPVVPAGCDASGALRCGVIGVAIDVYGGNHAIFEAAPDWAVTSALSVQRLRACTRGPLVVSGRALRSGRTQLVVEVEVHDAAPGPHAMGLMTFTRVPRRADTPPSPAEPGTLVSFATSASRLEAPLFDALGGRVSDAAAGAVELALSPYLLNSVGGLQGGAVVAVVEAAAEAAAGACGAEPAVLDAAVQYLAQGRVGPMRTRATRLRAAGGSVLWRVELLDAGQAGRRTAVASVTTGPLPRG